jgi:hypothetical protein
MLDIQLQHTRHENPSKSAALIHITAKYQILMLVAGAGIEPATYGL